jgi:hypothetical protein
MNARSKPQIRYAAALFAALLFAVGAGLHRSPTASERQVQVKPAFVTAPAVADRSVDMAAVTLPQITVRPSAAERAAALATSSPLIADNASPFLRPGDTKASGGGYSTSPRMNFDMPYYSFGKALPRAASRE